VARRGAASTSLWTSSSADAEAATDPKLAGHELPHSGLRARAPPGRELPRHGASVRIVARPGRGQQRATAWP